MKKPFPTYFDVAARDLKYMIVSAGKIGMQMKLAPADLARAAKAEFAAIIM